MQSDVAEIETTDPITELVELADILRSMPDNGGPFFAVFANQLRISPESPEMFDIVAAISRRLADTSRFVQSVQDRLVLPRSRQIALSGVAAYAAAFTPSTLVAAWTTVKNSNFSDQNLGNMGTMVPISSKYRSLRRLNQPQILEMKEIITDLLSEIEGDGDLPVWAVAAIKDAFRRLQLMLDHLPYFGHEAAIDQLVLISSRSNGLHGSLVAKGVVAATGLAVLHKTAEVIVTLGHLLCLPADVPHAYEFYQNWLSGPVIHQLAPPEQRKLLEAPKTESGATVA